MNFSDVIREVDFEKLVVGNNSPMHKLDARVKLIGSFALIFGIISMEHPAIPLFLFFSATLASFAIRIPVKIVIKRLLILPFSIAVVVLIVVVFTYGGEYQVTSLFGLPIYRESLSFAFLLFTRIIASISILNVFVATTQIREAMEAMQWFRMPKVVVDLAMMMLRYIHLLSEETVRMYRAQTSRGAFSSRIGYRQKVQNLGVLAGSFIIRSMQRGESVYVAMESRGYTPTSYIMETEPLSVKNAFISVAILTVTVLLVIVDHKVRIGAGL